MPRSDLTTRLRRDDVLKAIKTHPRITNHQLMKVLRLSYRKVQRATQLLERAGKIRARVVGRGISAAVQWRIAR